jgi:hypothetical protein
MSDYIITNNNELYHYGVKGMKWGVRRYQNFDGSYTKAGMKRYNRSLETYEKADERYKTAKKTKASKTEITNSRLARKQAKRRLDKDYKHLAQDKLADKGKEAYSKGKRITNNAQITNLLGTVAGISASAAAYNYQTGTLGNKQVTQWLAGASIATASVASLKKLSDYNVDRKLRAYYSHTSNY